MFGFSDLEIHASEDASTLQLFINGNPYRLGVVGSGLTQFILALACRGIRLHRRARTESTYPSLQVSFLDALGRYAKTGVVFATHSIGLARTTAPSIYSFQKVVEGRSEVHPYEATPRLAELMGEMSFSPYRELGYEKLTAGGGAERSEDDPSIPSMARKGSFSRTPTSQWVIAYQRPFERRTGGSETAL